MKIKVKLDEGAFIPERAHTTDAGADIRTPYDIMVPARGSAIVATGIHIETPANHVTMVKSKSGLNIKDCITSEGVVDEGFSGEILVKLYNHGDKDKRFLRGDKISQLVVLPVAYPSFIEAESISYGPRGQDGYGSTGR